MKKIFSVLLVSVATLTLAGCQSSSSGETQQSSKQETSQVSKKAQSNQASSNTSKKAAADSSEKASSKTASSKQATSTSDSAASQSDNQQQTTTSAQNLTSQQVQNWVARYLDGNYQTGDLTYAMNKDENGDLLIQVKENHQSTNMQNQGADPNTAPTVGWFKINGQGQLLKSPDAGASWNVVSNSYQS